TILFCGHDTGAVLTLCQRAVWLDNGAMMMIGPAKEVCEAYGASVYSATIDPPERLERAGPVRALSADESPEGKAGQSACLSIPIGDEGAVFDLREESSSFGSGLARISEVTLTALDGSPFTWIEGGEEVLLTIVTEAKAEIGPIIVGFIIKDRLGQPLLGDNTMRRYAERPVELDAGDTLRARFAFQLPLLASGRYSITVAVASGTLESHSQDHWLHDALMFQVHSQHTNGVLIALPMSEISLAVMATTAQSGV
ncbi:MAG: Wzt carbohydrate-binding domain-containing protein, partial [Bradyrhizobium sp.]